MGLLGDVGNIVSNVFDGVTNLADQVTNNNSNRIKAFEQDGFIVPPIPSPSGDGLPSSKIPAQNIPTIRRHIIHWYVPEVGMVNMYINPQNISYRYRKVISPERTKAGYVIQYWGEELPVLSISGHTGSSGIEGINVLQEIYRSEQINFDPIGLTMASANTSSGLNDLINGAGQAISGLGGDIFASVTQGILGLNPLTQSILPRNPQTLASLATGIELFFAGKVYRGFFTNFTCTESAQELGLFRYDIEFMVTQVRGYRTNSMPWHRSANSGPSNNSESGVPLSYGNGASFGV